jgi:hypothetical protein
MGGSAAMTTKLLNLFSFGKSELSQDALLCWMAALALSGDPQLAAVGKHFLAWLWSSAGRGSVNPDQVSLVRRPETQVERVDVLLHAEVAGKPVTFLIEDKTGTSHHSGQLGRYRDAVEKRLPAVVPIYFKTGYHFGEDVRAASHGYAVIGLEAWVQFLGSLDVKNDILSDYREHVSWILQERQETQRTLWTSRGFEMLNKDYAQFELMGLVQHGCSALKPGGATVLRHGTNVGGAPWTQLAFGVLDEHLPGKIGEALFHRVDKRNVAKGKSGYYLSTRQYALVKGNVEAKKAKVARLRQHREAFREAVKDAGSSLVFGEPAADHQGANESEIGVLFFDDSTNTTQAVRDLFPRVHEAFVKRLRAGSRTAPER